MQVGVGPVFFLRDRTVATANPTQCAVGFAEIRATFQT
jgi:hypothetical protein